MIKKLNILGWQVKVVYKDLGDKYCGLFYQSESLIEINKNMNKNMTSETILHELFHAVWKRAGIDQTQINADTQEIICEQFAKVVNENFRLVHKK